MKISVIIPTFNSEKNIKRTIESVLNQNGNHNLEILICDDCSTDNTLEICRNYDVKIFVNSENSGGANRGRNTGIKNATGDVITFLDHDDEWMPDKLNIQISEILKGYEFIYSRALKKLG